MKSHQYALFCILALFAALPSALQAQSAGTGSVSGRIYNSVTEEYVRNARVSVVQGNEVAISETGGFYQLSHLRPGDIIVEVSYIGHTTVRATATVVAGQDITLDFTILPADATGDKDEVVQLEKFVVSTEREGQAKAIMDQRASMNITQTIASDVFGDDPEGNIGEFLRNVPGVFLNTVLGEVRNVGLGGLDPEYTAVTVDGVSLAAADADGNNSSRAPSFEMVSLSSMESLEISRTISADVDANSPAGTINMRSKSAFDRRGTHFAARAVLSMSSRALTSHRDFGPNDNRGSLKIRPGFIAEFSTSMKNKFGLIINISESNIYSESSRLTVNYDRVPTVADPRLQVPNSIAMLQAPRTNRRFSTTIRMDWKPTRNLSVGLGFIYNATYLWNLQRNVTLTTGIGENRATSLSVVGDNPEYSFETTGNSYLTVSPNAVSKKGQTYTFTPRFEYRTRNLVVDGMLTYSDSMSWYNSLGKAGAVYSLNSPRANAHFKVERPVGKVTSGDYTITQLSGASVSGGDAFSLPSLYAADDRDSNMRIRSGQLNASMMTRWLLPINWKAGLKTREERRTFDENYRMNRVTYTGATSWADHKSPYDFDLGDIGVNIVPSGGGTLYVPSLQSIGELYRSNPEQFVPFAPNSSQYRTDYYYTKVYYHRNFEERVDAGYFMGTTTLWDKRIQARAGIRWENTMTDVREPDALTTAELDAAGYGYTATGIASTTEGIDYQFFSRPWRHRKKHYDDFFPSASLKYYIRENFTMQLGYSTTIRRPSYGDVAGVTLVNDNTQTITAPNINLKPEDARNYGARLAYYFRGVGSLVVAVYQNELKHMIQSDTMLGSQYGGELGEQYPGYDVTTRYNTDNRVKVRSLEIGYNQNMGFISPALKRLTLRLNYTRAYAEVTKSNMVPHSINSGMTYDYRRLNLYANCNWTDDFPTTATGLTYRRHRTQVDIGGGFKINRTYSLSFSVRNLTDAPYITLQHVPPSEPVLYQYLQTGAVISLSVKGAF